MLGRVDVLAALVVAVTVVALVAGMAAVARRLLGIRSHATDINDTVRRLRAYSEAGADCLYAPGIKTREHIIAVVTAVAPKPVKLLIGWQSDFTLKDAEAMGVRRISVGGALARAAWGGFMRAAKMIADEGRFDGLAGAMPGKELDGFFGSPG